MKETLRDYGIPYAGNLNQDSGYNEQWSCIPVVAGKVPVAINPPCTKSGINLDGAPVSDAGRSAFGTYSTYIHEPLQGCAVMAQLFSRTGRDGWGVNDKQVCRSVQFGDRVGRLNDSVSIFVAFMANRFCGLNLPTKTPTSGGRMFGFSDWLFSGNASPVTPPVVTNTNTPSPTKTPSPTPTLGSGPLCVKVVWTKLLNVRLVPSMFSTAYLVNISPNAIVPVEAILTNSEGTWARINDRMYFALFLNSNGKTYVVPTTC